MSEFTKGPWTFSNKGTYIGSKNHPIANVEIGVWGETFPTLQLEGPSLDRKVKAVIEMIEYGEIPEEEGKANARLIAKAPEMYDLLQLLLSKIVESFEVQYDNNYPMTNAIKKLFKEIDGD